MAAVKRSAPRDRTRSSSGCHPLSVWSGEDGKGVATGKGIETSFGTSGGGPVGAETDGYSSLQSPCPLLDY